MKRDGTGERWDGREVGRESREWSKVVRNCRIGSNPVILNIQVYLFAFNFSLLINLYHISMIRRTITPPPPRISPFSPFPLLPVSPTTVYNNYFCCHTLDRS